MGLWNFIKNTGKGMQTMRQNSKQNMQAKSAAQPQAAQQQAPQQGGGSPGKLSRLANWYGNRSAQKKAAAAQGAQNGMAFSPKFTLKTGKEVDFGTIIVIILAYAIWVYDLSGSSPYAGYKFSLFLITNTNWPNVLTSSVVSAFLVLNIFRKFLSKDTAFFVSLLILGALRSEYTSQLKNYIALGNIPVIYANIFLAILFLGVVLILKK